MSERHGLPTSYPFSEPGFNETQIESARWFRFDGATANTTEVALIPGRRYELWPGGCFFNEHGSYLGQLVMVMPPDEGKAATPQGDEPQVRPPDTDALLDEALKVPLTWHPRSEAEQRSFEAVFYVWTHLADALAREREARQRAVYIAKHLFEMVPSQVWIDSGGDDGQGHYEGDYRAEQVRMELKALASLPPQDDPIDALSRCQGNRKE